MNKPESNAATRIPEPVAESQLNEKIAFSGGASAGATC